MSQAGRQASSRVPQVDKMRIAQKPSSEEEEVLSIYDQSDSMSASQVAMRARRTERGGGNKKAGGRVCGSHAAYVCDASQTSE